MSRAGSVYRPRKPRNSPYYQCVEDHLEAFEQVYEDRFERKYGFFRPYVKQVICRYMVCGVLHNGFALKSRNLLRLGKNWKKIRLTIPLAGST